MPTSNTSHTFNNWPNHIHEKHLIWYRQSEICERTNDENTCQGHAVFCDLMPPWNSMTKNDHADVDRNMEPLTRKNKERSRHGGGDGPQGNWIYIYIYIYA